MKKILFLCIIVSMNNGCSTVKKVSLYKKINDKQLSCTKEAKPKSLQFLEQQYRCSSEE